MARPLHWLAREFGRVKVAAGFNVPPPDQEDGQQKEKKPEPRPWIQDHMRYSAISMHLTAHKHEGETAAWAGNSPKCDPQALQRPGEGSGCQGVLEPDPARHQTVI